MNLINKNIQKYTSLLIFFTIIITLMVSYFQIFYYTLQINIIIYLFLYVFCFSLDFYFYYKNNKLLTKYIFYLFCFIGISLLIFLLHSEILFITLLLIMINIYLILLKEKNLFKTMFILNFTFFILSFFYNIEYSNITYILLYIFINSYILNIYIYNLKQTDLYQDIKDKYIENKSNNILENKSLKNLKLNLLSNIYDISKYLNLNISLDKTSIYLKNIFFVKEVENKTISLNLESFDLENILNEIKNLYDINLINKIELVSNINSEKNIIMDKEKLSNFFSLILNFIEEENIPSMKVKFIVSGQKIDMELVFEEKIYNYINNDNINNIEKTTLWIKVSELLSSIIGENYVKNDNSITLSFKKI